jgi:Holliday junction resolvase RusA-like endonuclease
MIEFIIEGKPQPKQRPRFSKGHVYTPKETLDYEKLVRVLYISKGGKLHENALKMRVVAYYHIKGKKIGEYKTSRPDLSNIVKSIEDGLNGIAYKDDSQIVILEAEKRYAERNYVKVEITEL